MLDMAIQVGAGSDDELRAVLLARLPDAHRLASWILHDPVAAEDAVQELPSWHGTGGAACVTRDRGRRGSIGSLSTSAAAS